MKAKRKANKKEKEKEKEKLEKGLEMREAALVGLTSKWYILIKHGTLYIKYYLIDLS